MKKSIAKKYKPYPAYKDSGVEWLGEIPAHWQSEALKNMAKIQGGGTPSKDNLDYWDGDILWVSPKDMKNAYITDSEDKISLQAIRESATRIIPGNAVLVVVRSGILIHKIPVAISGKELTLNQDIKAFILAKRLSSEYLYYLINGNQQELLFAWKKEGATVESLEMSLVTKTLIPCPPPKEQSSIIMYLDRSTAKIDALLAKYGRLLELLAEKRSALISRAVTKGLDPDAPMKDSGVEWLGEIPHHWDIAVLKYMASMKSGDFIAIEDIHSDGRYPVYGGNGLRGYTEEYNCDGYFPLIGRQGALCGNINFGAGKFWATEHAIVVRPLDGIDPDWLGHILSIMNLNQYSMSSAQPGLSVGQISNLKTARLNSDDQIQISNYCKNETAKIDALVAKVERAVELLKERRVALISAAVTGKIDLREETT